MGARITIASIFRKHNSYKILITLIVICIIVTFTYWPNVLRGRNFKSCFINQLNSDDEPIQFLDDIMASKKKPQMGKTIFFHETSCASDGIVKLNAR